MWSLNVANGYIEVSEVRLVDGYTEYDGRVEIKVNGVWGSICDSYDVYLSRSVCSSTGRYV